ncbi:TadE/TadG family type IV pilus assembly protein [Microvirga roseola]|uniref:TadE/TadG family type IV pilus assembly protein n=1 Tax=Microvirga roseola TaxID=2883126 RepID=UPI00389913D9
MRAHGRIAGCIIRHTKQHAHSIRPIRRLLLAFARNHAGAAGIEFALIASALCIIILNGVAIAHYIYTRMQVENAAQMGTQAAWKACDPTELPATTLCPGLGTAIVAAVQSTSLGASVTLQAGSPSEGYFCLDASGALHAVGSLVARPVDCSATGMPNLQPGDYISVTVTYPYRPLFADLTVARFFATPINKTSLMRLL